MELRIATRRSRLARAQTQLVVDLLAAEHPGWTIEAVPLETRGDRAAGPLDAQGGKGLFTSELEAALRNGEVDLAVHSAKDMPAEMAEDLCIAAVPPRGDARDALVSPHGPLEALPAGATVGTGSPRRATLLRRLRGDLRVHPLRGNVETRLGKAVGPEAELDAVVLAMAGLERSGLSAEHGEHIRPLSAEVFPPAAGQGALVVQALRAREDLLRAVRAIHDIAAGEALSAERSAVARLGADCHSCLAVHIDIVAGQWRGIAMAARPDGSDMCLVRDQADSADFVGEKLYSRLCEAGAAARL
jgi:hydroxymethylbilane synthase